MIFISVKEINILFILYNRWIDHKEKINIYYIVLETYHPLLLVAVLVHRPSFPLSTTSPLVSSISKSLTDNPDPLSFSSLYSLTA